MLRKRSRALVLFFASILLCYALIGIANASQQTSEQNMSQEPSMDDLLLWLTSPAEPEKPSDSPSWFSNSTEHKKTVAVFVEIVETKLIKNYSKAMEVVEAKLNDFLPSDKFSILPLHKTKQALIDYKDYEGMIIDELNSVRISREGLLKVCNNIGGVDYAFSIYITHDNLKNTVPFIIFLPLPGNYQMNVTCDARLIDAESGEYVSRAKAEKMGNEVNMFAPDIEMIFCTGLSKALDAIEIDTSEINP